MYECSPAFGGSTYTHVFPLMPTFDFPCQEILPYNRRFYCDTAFSIGKKHATEVSAPVISHAAEYDCPFYVHLFQRIIMLRHI